MISIGQLRKMTIKSGLHLYQQEKDYLLKLYLHAYYRRYEDAVFKGGTCLRYLYGLDRFSEDLDFTLTTPPTTFQKQVKTTLKELKHVGIKTRFSREELFPDAYTCEIRCRGPRFDGKKHAENKFRIDAGKREGIHLTPRWELIASPYPETGPHFLVLALAQQELLAEKLASLIARNKGRDLYDAWFLIKKGVTIDHTLLEEKTGNKKATQAILDALPPKKEYERDLQKLTTHPIPYQQAKNDLHHALTP